MHCDKGSIAASKKCLKMAILDDVHRVIGGVHVHKRRRVFLCEKRCVYPPSLHLQRECVHVCVGARACGSEVR